MEPESGTPATTFAPVRAGKAQKCDPSEPARAGRIPRGPREYSFSPPAPSPLEFFTRLFLEYTSLLKPFFLAPPHAGPWGRRIREACGHFRRPQKPLSEHTEYPKSRSMGLFWNLNRAPVTTFAPVRPGNTQKWDPSEPAAAKCTSPGGRPGGATPPSACQPTSPQALKTTLLHCSCSQGLSFSTTPHARRGRRI